MNQLVKQMRPKWMLIGFTALALMVGLGASVGLDFAEQAIAQEELPAEGPVGGEPAAGGDANAAPADDENAGGNNEADEAVAEQSMLGWVYKAWPRLYDYLPCNLLYISRSVCDERYHQ